MKVVKILIVSLAGAYLCALSALAFMQRKLVFANDPRQFSPVEAGFPQADVLRLFTTDGETIVAWHAAPAQNKKLALYFHGNGGTLADRASVFRALTADGTGLLAIDYRGYGGSSGAPSEAGLYLDAEAAYSKARELGHAPEDIVVIGASLGTGVAVHLASRRVVAGVVLDSPYSSTTDVAADRYWMFPVSLILRDRFSSSDIIAQVRAPLLMMNGALDRTIPIRFGERLFVLANQPKQFLTFDKAEHVVLTSPEGIAKTLEFIDRLERVTEQ